MKILKKTIVVAIILLIVTSMAYLGVTVYYMDRFLPNLWINGNYCTGMTKEEVNDLLISQTTLQPEFEIQGIVDVETKEIGKQSFLVKDVDLQVDYLDDIDYKMQKQMPWEWPLAMRTSIEWTVKPKYSFSDEKLYECLEQLTVYSQNDFPIDYCIKYSGNNYGYYLYNGLNNRLNKEQAVAKIRLELLAGNNFVDFVEEAFYEDVDPDTKQKNTQKLWKQLEQFLTSGPTYDFQEELICLDEATMASFLKKDSKGIPLVDENNCFVLNLVQATKYLDDTLSMYDTYDKLWDFPSTRGDIIKVQGVTYGGIIDREKETEWFLSYLDRIRCGEKIDASERVRIPEYKKKPYYRGKKSVGSTYIEVDMGNQHLYYYNNGNLSVDSDIVTGNMKLHRDTPEGVNFVYGKTKNRILRGPGYATFVHYWMPVKGAIGIHDANWRKEFGEEIYLTDGSHGCVNMPVEKAGELFELVEIGTPVVMFY